MHKKKKYINKSMYSIQGLSTVGNSLPKSLNKILKKGGHNYSSIINNWGEYILHEKYLPQRGASFLLNDKNQVIYKFFSSDILGYSSNMRDPLGFLSDLLKE